MSALGELIGSHRSFTAAEIEQLQTLVRDWALLADLSFADLLLCVPADSQGSAADTAPVEFLVVAQVRPSTGPTLHPEDMLGHRLVRPGLAQAMRAGGVVADQPLAQDDGTSLPSDAIAVAMPGGRVLAVLARDGGPPSRRAASPLEEAYLRCAGDLAQMIAEGTFPFTGGQAEALESPRVGDGMLRLDAGAYITYASPNAVSAYRRLGHQTNLAGQRLRDVHAGLLGPEAASQHPTAWLAMQLRRPLSDELEVGTTVVLLRLIPLLPEGSLGALVLVRDVTELRRREAELVGKDATIREIHHRVKNNLQTVAALLRLQARRLAMPDARQALLESVRRVTSIALVHETLSQTLGETVDFDEVLDQLAAMTVDVASMGRRPRVKRTGSFGTLSGQLATPLAVVLSELFQNAVSHGGGSTIAVGVRRAAELLEVTVADDGQGLPQGFSVERSSGLGLQIVRELVVGELRGTFALRPRASADGGTEAVVAVPLVR